MMNLQQLCLGFKRLKCEFLVRNAYCAAPEWSYPSGVAPTESGLQPSAKTDGTVALMPLVNYLVVSCNSLGDSAQVPAPQPACIELKHEAEGAFSADVGGSDEF